jgi:hypothetical protein
MIQIGSRAKVFNIFRRVSARPDTFKTTLRKLDFFQNRREKQRAGRFCAKYVGLMTCMFVKKLRQSRVLAVDKIRKSGRMTRNKTSSSKFEIVFLLRRLHRT